jgi:Holliday junction resolvasome RuvABC endonuclease subunit
MIVSLDLAKKAGVCYLKKDKTVVCTTYEGTPQEQLQTLLDVLGDSVADCKFYIEQLNTFVNANTTRSLLHRAGYFKHTLEKMGCSVTMVNAMAARKHLNVKNKKQVLEKLGPLAVGRKMTDDEADALAILIFSENLNTEDLEVILL